MLFLKSLKPYFFNPKLIVMKVQKYFNLLRSLKELMMIHEDIDDVQLMEMMEKDEPSFTYSFETANTEDARFRIALEVKQEGQDGLYFLNRYQASLEYASPAKHKEYIFQIQGGLPISSREAFNLLEGRAVCKQLATDFSQKADVWLQFDFNSLDQEGQYKIVKTGQYHAFDLEAVLAQYNIEEMQTARQRTSIINCLRRGDLHPIHLVTGKGARLMHIRANPFQKVIVLHSLDPTGNRRKEDATE
jgi:hypothetical protein